MKFCVSVYLFVLLVHNSTLASRVKVESFDADTAIGVVNVAVSKIGLTKGLNSLRGYSIYNDTLYLVNKTKLIKMSLLTGIFATDSVVNAFLGSMYKTHPYTPDLAVNRAGYFFNYSPELYCLRNGEAAAKVFTYNASASLMDCIGNNSVFIVVLDHIKILSSTGKLLADTKDPDLNGADGYLKIKGGMAYQPIPTADILMYRFENNSYAITKKVLKPLPALPLLKLPYVANIADSDLFAFDYDTRDAVYQYKIDGKSCRFVQRVSVKKWDLLPGAESMEMEEGVPEFKIGISNNNCYLIAIAKGRLVVIKLPVK